MNLLKTFAAASVIALASFGANASQISSGGITWDPDYDNQGEDFFAVSVNNQFVNNDIVSGFGQIEKLNGQTDFCAYNADCTLSYVYSGFDMTNGGAGGTLDFYVNSNTDVIIADSQVVAGSLWLSLAVNVAGLSDNGMESSFAALLDVVDVAGTVASNFDTNTLNGSDMYFAADQLNFKTWGSADFTGNSIPEPTSIALFGLALMGLAGAARRKA